jgi:hypothetical protein
MAHLHLKDSAEDVAPAAHFTTSTASVPGGSGGRGRARISEIISTVLPCGVAQQLSGCPKTPKG